MQNTAKAIGVSLVMLLIAASTALAQQAAVNFNGLQHGEIVSNQFSAQGITISANNPNRPFDLAIIFDSQFAGQTPDPDLIGPPWSGGNLAPATVLEEMLILAENNIDVLMPFGVIDTPDDEASHPAGDLIFDFATPITEFGFDVVDVEGFMENGIVSLFSGGQLIDSIQFSEFVTPGLFFDPTVAFGDNTANRIMPITSQEVGGATFDRVIVTMGGSGALDNIVIPEPAAGVLLMGALFILTASRRKRP